MTHSRENPSPRYMENLEYCREIHEKGYPPENVPPERAFDGVSLKPHVWAIRTVIEKCRDETRATVDSILDYGSGKAEGYERITTKLPDGTQVQGLKNLWRVAETTFYDPAYAPFSALPEGRFDGVISTDVLEHCPEEDLDWIIREIFDYSKVFVFCTAALYPAEKHLPNGDNAHITQKSAGWWLDKFETAAKEAGGRTYFLALMRSPSDFVYVEG